MARKYYRAHFDKGTKGTIDWLARWYGDTTDLRVERLLILCPDTASFSKADARLFQRLRSGNQSELHTYLKFVALKWLENTSAFPDTIMPEVICYSPIDELCEGRTCLDAAGREFDIRSPRIIYGHEDGFPLSYGHTIRVDLHSFDISVEVGGTQPFNLLMPLLDGLSDQAIWLPYPQGYDTRDFACPAGGLGKVPAYSIRLCELAA
jgi:hypothetical protein